jgi:exosortase/archaeosortase family protein
VRLADVVVWLRGHRRSVALVGLLTGFTGVSMIVNPTHAPGIAWIGIAVLIAGFTLLWRAWPRVTGVSVGEDSLGSRFVTWFTREGRLLPLLPISGIALIAADLAYNFLFSNSSDLLTEDILVLLTAGVLLGYGFVPSAFARERDFALLFFVILDVILVAPLLLLRVFGGAADASVDAYSWTALAPEVGAILSLLGVANSIHAVAGYTAPGLTFTPAQMSTPVTLVITTACSGIYSFGIFASAYVAFLLTEYSRPSRRLWLLLGLGFVASYLANTLRMVIIVLVGYYTDSPQTDLQNLLLAHSYAGWIIFIGWLALFWGALFKWLPITGQPASRSGGALQPPLRLRRNVCSLCGGLLQPSMLAERCACGAVNHTSCLRTIGQCPRCHRPVQVTHQGKPQGD